MTHTFWTLVTMISLLGACGSSGTTPMPPDAAVSPDGAPIVDAAPPDAETCSPEGASRIAPCGNCGMQSEVCMDGTWQPQSACLNQGECAFGAVETEPVPPGCGEQQRLCTADCTWSDWTILVPPGECAPGEMRTDQADCPAGQFRQQICSEMCMWETQPDPCIDACGGTPRATLFADEAEVCVLTGDFIRGSTSPLASSPVTTVSVSSFYIDKYTVTNRRYKACRDAGACLNPIVIDGDGTNGSLAALNDPAFANHWVRGITWFDAAAFCWWDGGRRLVTEAEWEKAGRGPTPRMHTYAAWETTWDCTAVPRSGCSGVFFSESDYTDPYDWPLLSADTSYYGVVGMSTLGVQWTSDWYLATYYSDPSSLIDPQGPASGTSRTLRGASRKYGSLSFAQLFLRHYTVPSTGSWDYAIRCGRSAP